MSTYHSKLSLLALMPQSDVVGLIPGTPAEFTVSAGTTTTLTSAALAAVSDSDDDFVGYLVECVSASARSNQGLMKKIESYVDSTGVATVEKFPSAVASGDRFRLWIPPMGSSPPSRR